MRVYVEREQEESVRWRCRVRVRVEDVRMEVIPEPERGVIRCPCNFSVNVLEYSIYPHAR